MKEWSGKSELERTLQAGISGEPQLRREEKSHYLGEFRERVLRMLTRSQVGEPVVFPEIEEALKDPRSSFLVAHGDISDHALAKYRKLAERYRKPLTTRHGSEYEGETGLIVASREAVDMTDISVESREEKLLKRGLPEQLIDAAGEAICKDCYEKLQELAPEETKNYSVISPISRMFGEKCPAHE